MRRLVDEAREGRGVVKRFGFVLLVLALLGACGGDPAADRSSRAPGTLELAIRDASTGEPTPARIELTSADGATIVPDRALMIFDDCRNVPWHNWVPWTAQFQALAKRRRGIANPYTGRTEFYAGGTITAGLPAGRYTVSATKGIEYERARAGFEVAPGETRRVELELVRWADLPAAGWYGADDHLHIQRPHPRFDPAIAIWMRAEDIHVANLLQMGLARDVHITPQHGFGPRAVYRDGDTMLLSGQENPRTHVLGHSIVLGARRYIDLPSSYALYDGVWREAHEQGAANGYAHWALGGAEEGLAVWGHTGLLDFIEVLNLGLPFYERWYEALDLGLRIGPTAGSDYPCLPGLPGRERFYARVEGPLAAESWIEAVSRGRTFVTNGPVIELTVGGAAIGDELRLAAPGEVRIEGRVRFDPRRDAVTRLELVRAGEVVLVVEAPRSAGEITLDTPVEIDRSTWIALRARGVKRDEKRIAPRRFLESMLALERGTNAAVLAGLPEGAVEPPAAAHTGAVWVTVDGTPPIERQPRARAVAAAWLARLEELEARLAEERIAEWARFPGRGDGIDAGDVRASRDALLAAIAAARRTHSETARDRRGE